MNRKTTSCIPYQYSVTNRTYSLKNVLLGKNEIDHKGPYKIADIWTNSSVATYCDVVVQTINIRQLV